MYRNNELIIYCKYCEQRKKLRDKRAFCPNGNFCSRECFQKWAKGNTQSPEEKRKKWNKYQNEYAKRKLRTSEPYVVRQIRGEAKKLSKEHRRQRRIEKKELKQEKKMWTEWQRGFRKKHRIEIKREQRRRHKLRHPEQRRNGNGGIKRGAFATMRAEYNYTCPMCGQKEPFLNQYWPQLVQDHKIPRSRGGKKRAQENIQPLCWDCNTKKGNNLALLKLT